MTIKKAWVDTRYDIVSKIIRYNFISGITFGSVSRCEMFVLVLLFYKIQNISFVDIVYLSFFFTTQASKRSLGQSWLVTGC